MLFVIPLAASYTLKDLSINKIYESLENNLIDESSVKGYLLSISITYDFINIFLYMIFSIGIAGIVRVFKMLLWGEGVLFGGDFIEGIKVNYKSYLGLFFLIGSVVFLNNTILIMFKDTQVGLTSYLPWAISLVMLLPILLFYFSEIIYYQNSFLLNLINGTKLYLSSSLKTLLIAMILVISSLPVILFSYILIRFILILIWTILVLPILICGWILYSNELFDKYINCNQYPEIVNKGLYIETLKDKE